MPGAFLISRDIFENQIWISPTEFRLFILIVGKAVFNDEGAQVGNIHLKKGQWLRSYRNLQNDLEYIENNTVKRPGLATIKRLVYKMVDDGRITIQETELGTLFTVVNYAKYQALESYKKKTGNTVKNSNGTATEQHPNNNNNANNAEKGISNNPPIIPPEGKVKFLDYVYLTSNEHERLVTEFGHEDTQWMIEKLDNYIGQNPGKRQKKWTDHNRVIRGWVKDRLMEEREKRSKKISQLKQRNKNQQNKQREEENNVLPNEW